ncbi:serum response factor homolog A-like [Hermetia illucens]|uniref:serum response factor homolog A-like n=1 Tax=Hermetia illucens TaxID=343691 RepID=UPI0018CC278D|nr:serum response factor homolog A-like [Hermetia illucens]
MAQQLECQLAFIKELQQQMAELKAANMAAKQPVQHQQEQQQQLIVQQRQQQQEQRKQQRQQQQQQQRQEQQNEEDDGMCPEVIIEEEEGDPFNFVVRKKKSANRTKNLKYNQMNKIKGSNKTGQYCNTMQFGTEITEIKPF